MNEEEKQAYNYLEKYINWETLGERNLEGDIKTILNLIDKQQKEIEDLKKNNGYHLGIIDGGIIKRYEMQDKIKDLMKDYQEGDMVEITGVCKFLLGE